MIRHRVADAVAGGMGAWAAARVGGLLAEAHPLEGALVDFGLTTAACAACWSRRPGRAFAWGVLLGGVPALFSAALAQAGPRAPLLLGYLASSWACRAAAGALARPRRPVAAGLAALAAWWAGEAWGGLAAGPAAAGLALAALDQSRAKENAEIAAIAERLPSLPAGASEDALAAFLLKEGLDPGLLEAAREELVLTPGEARRSRLKLAWSAAAAAAAFAVGALSGAARP